jgi:hypothetical protein
MIVWASGLVIGVSRVLRPLREVGMLTMPDVWLDTMRRIEVSPGAVVHQQKNIPFGWYGSVRVDALRQSCQRHPSGALLRARSQYNASRCISPSDRCLTFSLRSVGLLF